MPADSRERHDPAMNDRTSSPASPSEAVPGAQTLPADLVQAIDRAGEFRDLEPGAVLLRQRERVRELTVLVSGRLSTLVHVDGVGDLVVETTDEPGRMFGWSGLRAPWRATATVRADDRARVVAISLEALADEPRWVAALCALVAGSLADRAREIQQHWTATGKGGDDA